MKKILVTYLSQISIAVLSLTFIAVLVAMLGYGLANTFYLLGGSLVLILLALALQIFASYLALSPPKDHESSYKYLHEAIHTSRNAYYYLEFCNLGEGEFSETIFKEYMISALTAMSVAFSMITGRTCRTCIKLVSPSDDGKFYLTTLVRDRKSSIEYSYVDEKPPIILVLDLGSDKQHIANSILLGEIDYYLNNDLSRSSSVADYLKSIENNRYDKKHHARENWKFPYLSTIFSPIRYLSSNDEYSGMFKSRQSEQNDISVYCGFFAVDSQYTDVFGELEHQMTATFTDSLFPVLSIYRRLQQDLPTTTTKRS